jgi:hypothetical protein
MHFKTESLTSCGMCEHSPAASHQTDNKSPPARWEITYSLSHTGQALRFGPPLGACVVSPLEYLFNPPRAPVRPKVNELRDSAGFVFVHFI